MLPVVSRPQTSGFPCFSRIHCSAGRRSSRDSSLDNSLCAPAVVTAVGAEELTARGNIETILPSSFEHPGPVVSTSFWPLSLVNLDPPRGYPPPVPPSPATVRSRSSRPCSVLVFVFNNRSGNSIHWTALHGFAPHLRHRYCSFSLVLRMPLTWLINKVRRTAHLLFRSGWLAPFSLFTT